MTSENAGCRVLLILTSGRQSSYKGHSLKSVSLLMLGWGPSNRVPAENFRHRTLIRQRQGACSSLWGGSCSLVFNGSYGSTFLGRKRLFGVIVLSWYVDVSKEGKNSKNFLFHISAWRSRTMSAIGLFLVACLDLLGGGRGHLQPRPQSHKAP